MQQLHVFFSGRVQGVGFRATTQAIAHELGLDGWVRNRRDGRVEALAQSDEATLREWLRRIEASMPGISSIEIDWQPVNNASREASANTPDTARRGFGIDATQ
ncbi:MAG: acylphosphatase [Abditibacteriota bacterium]|nr:acylphosphatase [Abditibacteriota bacterium]